MIWKAFSFVNASLRVMVLYNFEPCGCGLLQHALAFLNSFSGFCIANAAADTEASVFTWVLGWGKILLSSNSWD